MPYRRSYATRGRSRTRSRSTGRYRTPSRARTASVRARSRSTSRPRTVAFVAKPKPKSAMKKPPAKRAVKDAVLGRNPMGALQMYSRREHHRHFHSERHFQMMRNPGRSLMPMRYKTKLMYCDVLNVTYTAPLGVQWYTFRMNSLFDPDFTGIGHQPAGYDQITPFYNSWIVTGVKVLWEGRFLSGGEYVLALNGQAPLNQLPAGPVSELLEDRRTIIKRADLYHTFRIEKYYDVATVSGIPRSRMMDDISYSGNVGANPQTVGWVNLGSVSTDLSTYSVNSTITLVYYCEFFEPIEIGPSASQVAAPVPAKIDASQLTPELVSEYLQTQLAAKP